MSFLWKIAVFIENSPVTSSNCYETIQTASILIKLGKHVDWTIAFKRRAEYYFALIFFYQNWFQSAATFLWIEIESKAFQRWLRPGVIFSLSQVQNVLGDEGDYRPPSTPLMYLLVVTFLNNILKQNHVWGPK
jgi:hypothetical protein